MRPPERTRNFETDLEEALRRIDAPEGFADRVMARAGVAAAPKPAGKLVMMPLRMRLWATGALAAALAGGVFVTHEYQVRKERERVEVAQQQFQEAMQITAHALDHTRNQLRDAGIELGD